MARTNSGDLTAFVAVARTRSFTKAAAQLGMSQSAFSQAVRGLEDRVGLRLFTRTTRSVSPTQAGGRLLETIGPHLDGIGIGLAQLSTMRETIAGPVRITADEHAVNEVLWPKLREILPRYPEIIVELVTDYGLTDIAAEGYDAGVRPDGIVSKDMIAVQHCHHDHASCAGWLRPGLSDRGPGAAVAEQRRVGESVGRLVRAFRGLSPLLHKPETTCSCV